MEPGKIIILNGASSSGKTSILHAVQELVEEPYLEAGIDRFISMLPRRYLDRPLWDDVLGKAVEPGRTGRLLVTGIQHAIAVLAQKGNNVIADHVLIEPRWVSECADLFADLPAYLIGTHCPLDILEARERGRKNRTFGQARAQFDLVHRGAAYDLEVDTSVLSPEACARRIRARLQTAPEAFKRLKQQMI
jgi:chloramphenicol 3-O phosphotransferase